VDIFLWEEMVMSLSKRLFVSGRFLLFSTILTVFLSSFAFAAPGDIFTIAGGGVGDGNPATAAVLGSPNGVFRDSQGSLYIADSANHRIRKVDSAGTISTIAGTGVQGYSGDGGPAISANLNYPTAVFVDLWGKIYIADSFNHRIRMVDSSGIITTVAGNGTQGYSGDNDNAIYARLNNPLGIASDSTGKIYISDYGNQRIRMIDNYGVMRTVAGNGVAGYSGDGNTAISAALNSPTSVSFDRSGNLYISDYSNHCIRKVDIYGVITTIVGTGTSGYSGDGGLATYATINGPGSVFVDSFGNILFSDQNNNRVRKVDTSGVITTVAGNGFAGYAGDGASATSASINHPIGIAIDSNSEVYIADLYNRRIRKVDISGNISTVAGNGTTSFSGDSGLATSATLLNPTGIVADAIGNLYVADKDNSRIRKIDLAGVITTIAGDGTVGFSGDGGPATSAKLSSPYSVALDSVGNIYIADSANNRIRKIFPQYGNSIQTVIGDGMPGYYGDGHYAVFGSSINHASGIAVNSIGELYFADSGNHRIRMANDYGNGMMYMLAGVGAPGYFGDGGSPTQAGLNQPFAIAIDSHGYIYISDRNNNRIRKIGDFGIISTVAGNGVAGYAGDGGDAASASINAPAGIALDASGNLYIADSSNHRIRKVDTTGVITTVAGDGTQGFSGDNGPATSAKLNSPVGVFVDAAGNILIADSNNNRIRKILPSDTIAPVTTTSLVGGTYSSTQIITLSCNDGAGSGCAATYYCLGTGCTPTTPYSGAIPINNSTDLRFYSTDVAGNSEAVKTATYNVVPSYALTVSEAGTGSGTVTGTSISCTTGSTTGCSAAFDSGTVVTLTATATSGSAFTGWSGACSAISGNQCSVVMDAAKSVTATFIVLPPVTTITMNPTLPNGANGWYVTTPTINLASNKPGTTYYQWSTLSGYDFSTQPQTWLSGGTALNIRGDDTGNWYDLPFGFSFYGTTFTKVYVSSNGLISFGAADLSYSNSGEYLLTKAAIAPLWDDLRTDMLLGDDIYVFQPDADSIGFRWQAATYGSSYETNFEAILYRDGRIRFNYAAQAGGLTPTIGISKGDGVTYQLANDNNLSTTNNLQSILYTPTGWNTYTGTITVPTGNNTLDYHSVDTFDNTETVQSRNIKVDLLSPATAASPAAGAYPSSQNVVLSCSDGAGSGCAATYYCLGTGCTPTIPYTAAITIPASTDLRYYSTDVAGNSEGIQTATYTIILTYELTVNETGTGSGTVTGPNINCTIGNTTGCNSLFESGTTVILSANPSPGSVFAGWSGACLSISGDQCSVVMDSVKNVTAAFNIDCGVGPCPDLLASGQLWGGGGSINSLGEVVWSQYDPSSSRYQIFSSARGQLTNDQTDHYSPAINNLGDLVWLENGTIRGIIAGQPVTVATIQNVGGKIDLNDRGEVVWTQYDASYNSQIYSNLRGQLTSGTLSNVDPSINNQRDVVFTQHDPMQPGSEQIYKLAAGSTVPIAVTSDSFEHRSPVINDGGEVVWITQVMNGSTQVMQIVSSVRGVLVSTAAWMFGADLNNCGDVVYIVNDNDQKLYRLGSAAPCASYPGANDTQAQASPVTLGSIFTGLIDNAANPVDWYRFDAVSGDSLHVIVNFDNRPPNVLNIGLYDGQGNLLSGPTTANPLGIHTTAGYSGSYFLRVEAQVGRFGYSVSLSKYTNNCGIGPCPEVLASGQLAGASINSLGELVWSQYDQTSGRQQIFSSTRGQLTNDQTDHYSPAINNLGDLVWVELGNPYTLRGIIADQPITVTTSQNWIGEANINDRGEVVWGQQDGQGYYQIYSSIRGQLTSGAYYSNDPSINNQGEVVFTRFDPMQPGANQVFRLSAGSSTPVAVTNDSLDHRSPAISDSGEIVWAERDMNSPTPAAKVVSNVRGILVPVATDIFSVDLNNCGDVVYVTYDNGQNKLYRLGGAAPCMNIPERLFSLALGKDLANTGTGRVESTPAGISLSSTESMTTATFPASTHVTLTATPDANSVFTGWSGACSGIGACQVTMDGAKMVTVAFALKPADATPPITTASPAGGIFNTAQNVTLTCSDGTGSGCASTFYCLGSGCNSFIPYLGSITIASSTDLRFYSTDVVGNNELVNAANFTIDTTPPTVSIASPVSGISDKKSQPLNYSVSDGTVVVTIDGSIISKVSGQTIDNLADGLHTLIVEATDTATNKGSATVDFTVDTLAPAVAIDPVVTPTNISNQTISGSREADATIVITASGSATVGTITYPTATSWSATISGLVEGDTTITATASDVAGNQGSASATIRLDTVAPTVAIITPVAGLTRNSTQPLSYNVNDGTVVVNVDGVVFTGDTLNNLADGLHTVIVEATDSANNKGSATVDFTVDTLAPAVAINPVTSPTNQLSQTVSGSREADATIVITATSSASVGTIIYPTATTWSLTISGLIECDTTITATASDAAGNQGSTSVSIRLDTVAPTVAIITPVTGLTSNSSQPLSYSVSDGIVVVTVDGVVFTGDTLSNLADGLHTVSVEATDSANNKGSATVSFTVDTVAPAVEINPAVSPTNQSSQMFSGSREANAGIAVAVNTTATVGAVSYPTATSWNCSVSGLTEGNNALTATASDAAGNSSVATAAVTYDSVAPTVSISSPVGITNNNNPLLIFAENDGTIVVKLDGSILARNSGDTIGPLADGAHVVRVEATDVAGNTGSAEINFTVDTLPPDVSIDTVSTPTKITSQTITGVRENGASVTLAVNTAAMIGPVTYPSATTWSFTISNLVYGVNNITATARDAAGNLASATTSILERTH